MKKLTANDLLAGASKLNKKPGPPGYIDTHPNRDAIIEALRKTNNTRGVLRVLQANGDTRITRMMLQKLRAKINDGEL